MRKTILITGSTDGIGLETARSLVGKGHRVLLHGRNPTKLAGVERLLLGLPGEGLVERHLADLSSLGAVDALARTILGSYPRLDVLINNAGVYGDSPRLTGDGLDPRFAVNTIAPYLLTLRLLPLLGAEGRVINLSSAAQAPVDREALIGAVRLPDGLAYAQSKLALTQWSRGLALDLGETGPMILAVNPGSMLGTKMVREAFGVAGGDVSVGADLLCRASLDDEFANASGRYFDNDARRFAPPHPDALDAAACRAVIETMDWVLAERLPKART